MSVYDVSGNEVSSVAFEREAQRLSTLKDELLAYRQEMIDKGYLSPPGKLGLPPYLDEQRWLHSIPDAAFRIQAVFDRVVVYQLNPNFQDHMEETWSKDSAILVPDEARDRMSWQAPRGLLISAGLEALDNLRSNGIDLGHRVLLTKFSPYRLEIPYGPHKTCDKILVLRDGDICASEDLATMLQNGEVTYQYRDHVEKDAQGRDITMKRHYIMKKVGEGWEVWNPDSPWIAEDH